MDGLPVITRMGALAGQRSDLRRLTHAERIRTGGVCQGRGAQGSAGWEREGRQHQGAGRGRVHAVRGAWVVPTYSQFLVRIRNGFCLTLGYVSIVKLRV